MLPFKRMTIGKMRMIMLAPKSFPDYIPGTLLGMVQVIF
jgi:hypothetical protein